MSNFFSGLPGGLPIGSALETTEKLVQDEVMTTGASSVARPPGGARRDRTDDLMLAKHALSQLSYGPLSRRPLKGRTPDHGGPGTTRTSDLTLIRGAL